MSFLILNLCFGCPLVGYYAVVLNMTTFVEKYRPSSISDIVHQESVSKTLIRASTCGILPHLILHGPPGTGKTSSILAFANTFYKGIPRRECVLNLNASDERCLNTVRKRIRNFTMGSIGDKIPFKLVILDEADALTNEAQAALRRIMEDFSKITRFCLIANQISKISDPILSRCAGFRFNPIPVKHMTTRLEHILKTEGVTIDPIYLNRICELSGGDMRKGIFNLQSILSLGNVNSIDFTLVDEICGKIGEDVLKKMRKVVTHGDFYAASCFSREFVGTGYCSKLLVHEIQDFIVGNDTFCDKYKSVISIVVSDTDMLLCQGGCVYLHIMNLFKSIIENRKV